MRQGLPVGDLGSEEDKGFCHNFLTQDKGFPVNTRKSVESQRIFNNQDRSRLKRMPGNSHSGIPDPGAPNPRIQAAGPFSNLPVLECLLLAVAHHWSIRESFDRQVELLERFFNQDQMKAALTKLEEAAGLAKHTNRRTGATKTGTRAMRRTSTQL